LICSQTRDTVDFDTAAASPRDSTSVASMSRVDSPRTNPAITNASSALVLVTPVPNSCEANRSVVPRSFGRGQEPGPLRWPLWRRENGAAFVRDTDRTVMPLSSWIRMVLGTADRNCRLLP
jgi:hypothetical protein